MIRQSSVAGDSLLGEVFIDKDFTVGNQARGFPVVACDKILITEIGTNISSYTIGNGYSRVRGLQTGFTATTPTNTSSGTWVTLAEPRSPWLDAVGHAAWRPKGGVVADLSGFSYYLNADGETVRLIQVHVNAALQGIGRAWCKFRPYGPRD